ncbi:Uu.00g079580.m01.CDS01 [Anthostomella pinea]|uniref:Uu.00g079580.m01.CDS01 n=1 Tax=Anthostomella pinea TaxID=933095 RepID=A0AAI8VLG5_9PEZI|nr:Uu.00g079580.m01.CDS01 [Anthostomella pinea]
MSGVSSPEPKVVYDENGKPVCHDHREYFCQPCGFFTGFFHDQKPEPKGLEAELAATRDKPFDIEHWEPECAAKEEPAPPGEVCVDYCAQCELNWLELDPEEEKLSTDYRHFKLQTHVAMGRSKSRNACTKECYEAEDAIVVYPGTSNNNDKAAMSAFFGSGSRYHIAVPMRSRFTGSCAQIRAAIFVLYVIRVKVIPAVLPIDHSKPDKAQVLACNRQLHHQNKFSFRIVVATACEELIETFCGGLRPQDLGEGRWELRDKDGQPVPYPAEYRRLCIEVKLLEKEGFSVMWNHVARKSAARADDLTETILPNRTRAPSQRSSPLTQRSARLLYQHLQPPSRKKAPESHF